MWTRRVSVYHIDCKFITDEGFAVKCEHRQSRRRGVATVETELRSVGMGTQYIRAFFVGLFPALPTERILKIETPIPLR